MSYVRVGIPDFDNPVTVSVPDFDNPVTVSVPNAQIIPGEDGAPGAPGKDGFSPTVVVERIEGTDSGLIIEDIAGNRWSFPEGAGTGDDITITDGAGNLWHMPTGAATGGEIPMDDGSGGAWHIPVGGTGGRSGQRITITDATGDHVFYIWDGRDGGGGGTSDYTQLTNVPSINEHTLSGGENSLVSLGIGRASTADINRLF